MNEYIVDSSDPVILVGGGDVGDTDLALALTVARTLVAADGGAGALLARGYTPDAVIGDMDSLTAEDRARMAPDRIHPIPEQDSTDFDKTLRHVRAPLTIGVGFLGARLDHQLAALNVLARRPAQRCLLLGSSDVVFLAPPELGLPCEAGTRISLFPMAPCSGTSSGLEWPIDGIDFAPDGVIGTSNRATGPVRLRMDVPGMVVMAPRAQFAALVAGCLSGQWPHWPARG